MNKTVYKGFIKDWEGKTLLPITRGELVLDSQGKIALQSEQFLAKDGHPGLVTAKERDLINSLTGANGELGQVADIYQKLGYLNVLRFGSQNVYHYDTDTGDPTPIEIVSDNIGIAVNTLDNKVTFSLMEVSSSETKITNTILKNIEVDEYGRVTSVSSGALDNTDIPQTLSGKVLQNCTTADTTFANNSIVNKAYVDAQFQNIAAVSTGSIKFKGTLSDQGWAYNALTDENLYSYYIIASSFEIDKSYVYNTEAISSEPFKVQVGDTLVIYKGEYTEPKFVYIPSGDEKTTISITNKDGSNYPYTSSGHVVLKLQDIFDINPQLNIAEISLKAASKETGGYLTKDDWVKFNSYASQESTTYKGKFSEGAGVYEIGTLTIAGIDNIIYGKYSTSSLSLMDGTGTDGDYNPILKFTSTGQNDVNITVTGVNGIIAKKRDDNNIEISANNQVSDASKPYLTIEDGHKFSITLGEIQETGIKNGLVDFNQMLTILATYTDHFKIIENSLTDTSTDYYYGSDKLVEAITLTI